MIVCLEQLLILLVAVSHNAITPKKGGPCPCISETGAEAVIDQPCKGVGRRKNRRHFTTVVSLSAMPSMWHDDFWESEKALLRKRERTKDRGRGLEVKRSLPTADGTTSTTITTATTHIRGQDGEASPENGGDGIIRDAFPNGKDADVDVDVDTMVHFCFVVPGLTAYVRDLLYVQRAVERAAEAYMESAHAQAQQEQEQPPQQTPTVVVVVHRVVCNEDKTFDGVENGGRRATHEIMEFVRQTLRQSIARSSARAVTITLSMIGNSLGGVYSRYVAAQIYQQLIHPDGVMRLELDMNMDVDTNNVDSATTNTNTTVTVTVHFNAYCSISSPHLGVSEHTYLPIPRIAEKVIAHGSRSQTLRDLFRCNGLLKDMGTLPEYLEPLGLFRTRTAFANAYRTDFPVPTNTAAFLHRANQEVHVRVPKDEDDDLCTVSRGLIVASYRTSATASAASVCKDAPCEDGDGDGDDRNEIPNDFVVMSQNLDRLGWRKVFVDLRSQIRWRVSCSGRTPRTGVLRTTSTNPTGRTLGTAPVHKDNDNNNNNDDDDEGDFVTSSADLASAFARSKDCGFHAPSGHNMICAYMTNYYQMILNRKGRPVVDALAMNIVRDMMTFSFDQALCNEEKVMGNQDQEMINEDLGMYNEDQETNDEQTA